MSRVSVPWRWLLLFILYVLTSLLFFDLYIHKGYENSKTYQILTDSGVQFYVEQVHNKLKVYTDKAYSWLLDNVPYYFEKTCDFVGPYLQLFWEKLYDFGVYIVEVSKPTRIWLNEKMPLLLEWINEKYPIVWNAVCTYLSIAYAFVLKFVILAWQYLVHYLNIIYMWLLENVFIGKLAPEHILHTLSEIPAFIQTYMVRLTEWMYALLSKANGEGTA